MIRMGELFWLKKEKLEVLCIFPNYSKLIQRAEITSLSLPPHSSGHRALSSAFDSLKRGRGKIRLFPPGCCFSLLVFITSPSSIFISFSVRGSGMNPCQLLHRSYYFISNYLPSHILIPFLVGASENVLFPNLDILKHAMQPVIQKRHKK